MPCRNAFSILATLWDGDLKDLPKISGLQDLAIPGTPRTSPDEDLVQLTPA